MALKMEILQYVWKPILINTEVTQSSQSFEVYIAIVGMCISFSVRISMGPNGNSDTQK